MTQILCKNLSLGYKDKTIIRGLNFSVERGDYLCLLGENGAGKSTLVKVILNLCRPKEGEVVFGDGVERYDIGYLPQQLELQNDFPAVAGEIILSGLSGRKFFYGKKDKKLAEEMAGKTGVKNLLHSSYTSLSGGQKQRVLLARAMCAARKILVLDEPVASLDPEATNEMYKIIKSLNDSGMTIIMISHDMAALKYANKVLKMGSDPFFGTAREYKDYIMGSAGKVL